MATSVRLAARATASETDLIDQAMLSRHVNGVEVPIHYMAGPPGMVTALRAMLTKQSVNGGDIRAEELSGY